MSGEISVVHLVYVPYGIELFQRFLNSYIRHQAGVEHKLLIVFNGADGEDLLNPFLKAIDSSGLNYETIVSREKWDISSYFFAAQKLDSEYLLFLNSYSIILADNWLSFYSAAMQQSDVGVVGATGAGWRSEFKGYLERNRVSRSRDLKSIMFLGLYFNKFRGPNLRTNAFYVNREKFLSLTYNKPLLERPISDSTKDSKIRTLYFEHGNQNMTYQFAKQGLKALVIDKYGHSYEPKDWMRSKTFWIAEQQNLLIHDNRTIKYQDADEQLRAELSYEAWGRSRVS